MRYSFKQIASGLLLPSVVLAQNSTTNTTTSGVVGILSDNNVALGDWADAYAKATALVAQMSNEDKITVITGGSLSALNWTVLEYKDGSEGVEGTFESWLQVITQYRHWKLTIENRIRLRYWLVRGIYSSNHLGQGSLLQAVQGCRSRVLRKGFPGNKLSNFATNGKNALGRTLD